MKKILLQWFVITLGIFAASYFVSGFEVSSVWMMIFGAVFLGLLNITLKPALLVLTLPLNVLTLGLFTFIINGTIIYIVGSFMKGWHVDSFWTALLASLVISGITMLANFVLDSD